jgi:hypothetical protein
LSADSQSAVYLVAVSRWTYARAAWYGRAVSIFFHSKHSSKTRMRRLNLDLSTMRVSIKILLLFVLSNVHQAHFLYLLKNLHVPRVSEDNFRPQFRLLYQTDKVDCCTSEYIGKRIANFFAFFNFHIINFSLILNIAKICVRKCACKIIRIIVAELN